MSSRFTSDQFVGRQRELTVLAGALEAAAEGRTTTILVSGEAGLGASRLIDEAERRLAELGDGFTVIRCGRPGGRRGEPYSPIVSGFGRILGDLPDDALLRIVAHSAEPLVPLFPDLADRLRRLGMLPERPWQIAPERRQARLLEAFLGVLERLGERSPVLLTIEDLHAADEGTRALATFLARVNRPSRICFVATYQPDDLTRDHPLRTHLDAIAASDRTPLPLVLEPMGRDDLADLIAGIEGERPSAAVLLLVAERSGGNPLVAEEILAARRQLSGVALASTFSELVTIRRDQLSPEARRVLRFLAAAGDGLTLAELARVAESFERASGNLPPRSVTSPRRASGPLDPDLTAGLADSVAAGFVESTDAPLDRIDGDVVVTLRHELIARSLVSDLLPNQRRRLHAALGAALRDRPAARLEHLLASHDIAGANRAALEAADRAARLAAPGDELAALEMALELAAPARDAERRREYARLLGRAAEAALGADRAARGVAYLEAAITRLGERADRLELARLYDRLGRLRRVIGDQSGSLAAHRRAVELVPRVASADRAALLAGRAQALMLDGQLAASERTAAQAIETARAVGGTARAAEGHALCSLGIARAWGREPEASPPLLDRARRIAIEEEQFDDLFRAIANTATALELLGRRDEALAVTREGIERARELGLDAVYGNMLRGNATGVVFRSGRWDEARAMCRTALEWSPAGPIVLDATTSLAAIEVEASADEAAAALLGRLLLALETRPDPQDVGPASRAAASFALWRGDVADARRAAELGWTRIRGTEDWILIGSMASTMLEVLAAVVADARDRRDLSTVAEARAGAASVLGEMEAAVRRVALPRQAATYRQADATLATARAFKARIDGRDDPSVWEAVARTWERLGEPYQVARARWRQAQATLEAHDDARASRRAAQGPLREAARIARELGARPLLHELEELAGRALISLPAAPVEMPAQTSSRDGGPVTPGDPAEGGALEPVAAGTAASSVMVTTAATRAEGLARAFVGPPTARGDTFGLSSREREVLALIVEGRTNREIGERLFISQKTVGVHVGNVLAKMRVSGRVEAATVAIRLGLTDA